MESGVNVEGEEIGLQRDEVEREFEDVDFAEDVGFFEDQVGDTSTARSQD